VGKSPLHPGDPHIVALAAAGSPPAAAIPLVDLDDMTAIADFVCAKAEPLAQVLAALEGELRL